MLHKMQFITEKRIPRLNFLNFTCFSSKRELIRDIDLIFIECGINQFGYHKTSDTYWGKKIEKNNICNLYFKINIDEKFLTSNKMRNSNVTITIIHGNEFLIKSFCDTFYMKMCELDE